MFRKILFFENRWCKFHFCQHEIDYTTFVSAFFCQCEMIWVRKTAKPEEICDIIKTLKYGKSTGPNSIPTMVLTIMKNWFQFLCPN